MNPSFSDFWRNDRMRPPLYEEVPRKKGLFHKKVYQILGRRRSVLSVLREENGREQPTRKHDLER